MTDENAAAWGWNEIVDSMGANHCRQMIAMGHFTLAILGWTDSDIRQMQRKAEASA